MSCIDCPPENQVLGANPANIHWNVVRGDTAKLRVSFFENDESTGYDTNGWTYKASAYSPVTGLTDILEVIPYSNYIDVIATASVTDAWGEGFKSIVAELNFDIEVTIPASPSETEDTIWTPVIGTISVQGDITRGL
jgi:hypothetical protein